ncbi:hypothetical protein ACJZ2D_016654 [Fusarium nematophilum]
MSYVTNTTVWLSGNASEEVKGLIARFYELADSKRVDAGDIIATQIFTKDATLISPNGTFQGAKEIRKSRDSAWSVVTSRRHSIFRVFSGDAETPELALLGSVHMEFTNGRDLTSGFAAHIKFERPDPSSAQVLISFMKVFSDTSRIAAVLHS